MLTEYLLKAWKKMSISVCRKSCGWGRRWGCLNWKLLTELKHKSSVGTAETGAGIQDEYSHLASACTDGVKDKAQLEMKIIRNVKGRKKDFDSYVNNNRKATENFDHCWMEGTVIKQTEKADIVKISSSSVFSGKFCSFREAFLTSSRISSTSLPS